MKRAYNYQRFSSIKQRSGDSLRRQTEAANRFCQHHGLTLVNTFTDEGISGFKGKNFSHESALSQFLKLVENGKVETGSVLVVENMDRLSRQSILPCLSKFIEIINKGVSVGVISQGKILNEKSITENPMEIMLVLVEFARANNESETKSKRLKAVVNAKIERIKKGEKIFFVQKPSWVIGIKNGKFILDTGKVKIVKDIFKQYLAGDSSNGIADLLNERKIPTLRGFDEGLWTNATVSGLLKNKNVIGWFKINGVEIDNYFPIIIGENDFLKTQHKLKMNTKNRGGSKYGLVRNLFKGLLFCSECGQTIETKIGQYKRVDGQINHYSHYICRGVKGHSDCINKGRLSVHELEKSFFDFILHPKQLQKETRQNERLQELQNELAKLEIKIARMVKLLESDELAGMAELAESLVKLQKQRETFKKQIDIEADKMVAQANEPIVIKSLLELKEKVNLGETPTVIEERKYIRSVMPTLYKKITLNFTSKEGIIVQFHHRDSEIVEQCLWVKN